MSSNIRPLRSMLPAAHQERLSDFAIDLQVSVKRHVPTDFGRYQRAAVLTFHWSNDAMGVRISRDESLQLLNRVYGFKIETHVLNANDTLVNIVDDFKDKL